MSTTDTHPTQIVLPGQTAAPDGPADMRASIGVRLGRRARFCGGYSFA